LIKIISGIYGYRKGRIVTPKTCADEPFCLTAEQEKALVDAKAAVYVKTYSADMKFDVLKNIAKSYGVDASKARSKAEVISMIDDALKRMNTSEPKQTGSESEDTLTPEIKEDAPPPLDVEEPV